MTELHEAVSRLPPCKCPMSSSDRSWTAKVLDPTKQSGLEDVRVVGLKCGHQSSHQEGGNTGISDHGFLRDCLTCSPLSPAHPPCVCNGMPAYINHWFTYFFFLAPHQRMRSRLCSTSEVVLTLIRSSQHIPHRISRMIRRSFFHVLRIFIIADAIR